MFLTYKVEVENQLNKKIKIIRSDRGGERKNRTLKEMMNVMLISSNAPYNLWG